MDSPKLWLARHPDIKLPVDREFTAREVGIGQMAQKMHVNGLLVRVRRDYKQTVWRVSDRMKAAITGQQLPKKVQYPGCEFIDDMEDTCSE